MYWVLWLLLTVELASRMRIEEAGGAALLQEVNQLGELHGRGSTSPLALLSAATIGFLCYEACRELYAQVRALFA